MTTELDRIAAIIPGYPGHMAWCIQVYGSARHRPSEGTVPVRLVLRDADLRGADLRGAHLEGANLEGAHLEGADLEGANLKGAHLKGAHLEGAHLEGADLEGAHLEGADLEGANLEGAHLEGAHLKGANLKGANLRCAYLEGAYLRCAYLRGAYLWGAKGVRSAGPVGYEGRMIYGVAHEGGAMIQCGCWWGTVGETMARVAEHYAGSPLLEGYLAAVRWVGGVTGGAP